MTFVPQFLRYTPFGCVYTLSEDEDLLYTSLNADGTYSTDLSDYVLVEIDEVDDELVDELVLIHSTLLGMN